MLVSVSDGPVRKQPRLPLDCVPRPVRTVLFSTLYPSIARPGHGIFVETRLRELLRSGAVQTKVMAPVPWLPPGLAAFGRYAAIAATPHREVWNGVDVLHPRYPLLPKVGMTLAPLLLAMACVAPLRRLVAEGLDFDLFDAHYYYPDGVAAAWLGMVFAKPVVITARGSDLNLIGRYRLPRAMMSWASRRAAASIGVCNALVDVLRDWGVGDERLHVMRNGVDLCKFRLRPREEARHVLGLDEGPLLLSVGHLVELKGHGLVIEALARLLPTHPNARLVVIGHGPERAHLEAQAQRLGVAERVRFLGAVAQEQLVDWYGAANVLVLASSREGWANVLLEAMACGTPVVATRAGGTPEVVAVPAAGRLVDVRSASAIAEAINAILLSPPEPRNVRAYAESFSWDATTRQQIDLFRALTGRVHA